MTWFRQVPMAALAIVLGTITVIGWITLEGTVPLVISIVAGALIALRAVLGDE
ncbi:MAG: hypothetical protein WDZ96_07360 [Acidimicrobiia bacterium]